MPQDFAIFILSHNRARGIDTLTMLKRYGYNGNYYVVISDDDSQIDEYKSIVDKGHLLIFDKEDFYYAQDTFVGSAQPVVSASLYARNFIIRTAKLMGLKHFIMADDDINGILFRYEEGGKMRTREIEKITPILEAMLEFIECSGHIGGLCFALDDGYFGGLNGNFAKGLTRKIFQFMMFKTSETWEFVGARWEDSILSMVNKNRLFFCIWLLSIKTPKMRSNRGGIEYANDKYYDPLFLMVASPSGVEPLPMGKRKIYENRILPKIIKHTHKK